nr:MAG TPA: hypothetical protein [Caudoviricetes sp.]
MTLAAIIAIIILSVLLTAAIGTTLFFVYIAYLMTEERDDFKRKYKKALAAKNVDWSLDNDDAVSDFLKLYNSIKEK